MTWICRISCDSFTLNNTSPSVSHHVLVNVTMKFLKLPVNKLCDEFLKTKLFDTFTKSMLNFYEKNAKNVIHNADLLKKMSDE